MFDDYDMLNNLLIKTLTHRKMEYKIRVKLSDDFIL